MPTEKPKFTAEGVAAWRAAGAKEKDERVRNPDYLAVHFLRPVLYLISQVPFLTKLALRRYQKLVPGGYFFHIARTKHMDAVLQQCIKDDIEQFVILGAGYDTRAYRFRDALNGVRVFEVDHPPTQERKKQRLKKFLGQLPQGVTYVPADFNKQSLPEVLTSSGYDTSRKTLFLLEGVIMYITPEAADKLLGFVATQAAPGSSIVFDYVYREAIAGSRRYYGSEEGVQFVANLGEPYLFGIEEGEAPRFLEKRGLETASDYDAKQLERAYLVRTDGTPHGQVYGYVGIVHARVPRGRPAERR